MNVLSIEKQAPILNLLVEGNSIRSIARIMNGDKKTVLRMLEIAGQKAQDILDSELVNIKSNYIQCDEIWAYVGKKQKQLDLEERYYSDSSELVDQYTFVSLDAETKLVINYYIGKRTIESTNVFIEDLNARVSSKFQLSTDAFKPENKNIKRIPLLYRVTFKAV